MTRWQNERWWVPAPQCAIVHAPWEPLGPVPFPDGETHMLYIEQKGPVCPVPDEGEVVK